MDLVEQKKIRPIQDFHKYAHLHVAGGSEQSIKIFISQFTKTCQKSSYPTIHGILDGVGFPWYWNLTCTYAHV